MTPAEPSGLRLGVVGAGRHGSHHVRILAGMDGVRLAGVYDLDPDVCRRAAARYGCVACASLDELAGRVEAAVVAVPTVAHAEIGCRLLAAGIHVLVEKPMAASLAEADALLAAAGDRVLAVGHVEFFNPAVQALLGLGLPPGFIEVHRLAEFKPRSLDVDVILDLMIHDLQILHALDPSEIREIRATGVNVLTPRTDIANVRVALASGCVANLTASRVSGEPVRKLRAFLPSRYYSLDYAAKEVSGYRLIDRDGERRIVAHDLEVPEDDALEQELAAFVGACRGRAGALVDGARGRRALETALAVAAAIESAPGGSGGASQEESGDE